MLKAHLAQWPGRRWLAVGLSAPVLAALYVRASETPLVDLRAAWLILTALAAVVGGGVLASYLPARGWRLNLGCSPCAAVAGLSLVGAAIAVATYGSMWVGPGLAAAVSLYGLSQRIAGPENCAAPGREASS